MATPKKKNEKEPLLPFQAFSFSSNTLSVTDGHVNNMFITLLLQGFSEQNWITTFSLGILGINFISVQYQYGSIYHLLKNIGRTDP